MKQFNNGSNLSTIKSSNRSLVLRVLNSMGQVSRAELARITGLTKTSITNIIGELIEEGIIYETGTSDSSSGRKPILLNLSKNALYAVGVYISRDFTYCNMVNLKGEIIRESRQTLEWIQNEQTFLSVIFDSVNEVLAESNIHKDKILGIGVATVGPLDIRSGIILDPPNFRGLKSIHILEAMQNRFNIKAFLENDMNACAIAEKLFGKGKNISNFIYVGVTNGIGAGIILNNNIYRGVNGFAGEIGHTTIDIGGERCACGNLGCLELYASIPNTVNRVRTAISLGAESGLSSLKNIIWTDIAEFARQGDSLSLKVIDKLAFYLSFGLVNTVNSFDPEIIFLGHEIALAGELITRPLSEMVNQNLFFRNATHVRVELSAFKDYAPCIGAPSIVLNKFFNGEMG